MEATGPTFAELVDAAALEKGLNDYQLSAAIGLMPGNRVCSPKQVSRIRKGEQVNYHRDLVQRLVDVLDLDSVQAWQLAGLWPPGLTAEQVRKLGLGGNRRRSDRTVDTTTPLEPAAGVLGSEVGDGHGHNSGGSQVQSGDLTEARQAA